MKKKCDLVGKDSEPINKPAHDEAQKTSQRDIFQPGSTFAAKGLIGACLVRIQQNDGDKKDAGAENQLHN